MAMTPVNLILLGPPGVGKSTQAELLRQHYRLATLSTGTILRDEVAAATPLGQQAQAAIENGQLVSDALMIALVRQRMEALRPDVGVLLDGFPRTIAQAVALDALLADLNRPLTLVAQPLLTTLEVIRRMSSRRACRRCHESTQLVPHAPRTRCARCGGELAQRPDDRPDVIRKRLAVYAKQTAPLAAYYQHHGLLAPLDGQGTPAEVAARISNAIELQRLHRRAVPSLHARAIGV